MKTYISITKLIIFIVSFTLFTVNLNAQEDNLPSFQYRAWGMGGEALHSKATLDFDANMYTVKAFSEKSIAQTNASLSGEVTTIIVHLEKDGVTKQAQLTLAKNYLNSEIVIKVYHDGQLVGQSFTIYLENEATYIQSGFIQID